jgi:hypothetical protein
MCEIKKYNDVLNSWLNITEKKTGKLEDITRKAIKIKEQKEKWKKYDNISELWDNFKMPNVHIIIIFEEEGVDRKIIEEIMTKFFQVWWKL